MSGWTWDKFAQVAAARGAAPAVRHGAHSISYTELAAGAGALAASLPLQPGERAIICARNSIPAILTIAAVWRRGGVPVLVNADAPAKHLTHAIAKTDAALLCAGAGSVAETSGEGVAMVPVPDQWDGATATPAINLPPHGRSGADTGSIVFTSGSTGLPKGVAQLAATLIDGAERIGGVMGYSHEDSILCTVPFTFDYGWGHVLSMFFTGTTLVLPETPNGFGLCGALARHRPTVLAGVPAVLADLFFGLAPLADTSRDSVRLVTNTGSKIPNPVFDALLEHFPQADISLNYGLTETYRSATLPFALARSHRHAVGRAVPGAELVIRREDGSQADVGEIGEICHFGAGLFEGYWNDPEKTAETRIHRDLPDGTRQAGIRTGDYGWFDADGLLYLHGRRDRIVKCMGVRLSLAEIEGELQDTGLVREAAVTAADHDVFGSFITAHVVPREVGEGADKAFVKALRSASRGRLNAFMMPRRFMVYGELPKTTSRKVDYVELRERAQGTENG